MLHSEGHARRRAGLTLFGIGLAVVGLIGALLAVVITHNARDGSSAPTTVTPAPATPRSAGSQAAAENELAARPMLVLPAQAAQPQLMTTQTAGPAITLPPPTQTAGRWIPGGFPATAEGAMAQLKALDETGMRGGDPQVYARAYRELSLPGAPDPGSTGLSAVLRSFRSHARLADTGVVPGLEVSYQVTQGLVKGSTDAGRYTVVSCPWATRVARSVPVSATVRRCAGAAPTGGSARARWPPRRAAPGRAARMPSRPATGS